MRTSDGRCLWCGQFVCTWYCKVGGDQDVDRRTHKQKKSDDAWWDAQQYDHPARRWNTK